MHLASANIGSFWVVLGLGLGVLEEVFEPLWLSSLLLGFFPMSVRDWRGEKGSVRDPKS